MPIFTTQIKAIDPDTGELCTWSGIRVEAINEQDARLWLKENGYGYCRVIGILVSEGKDGNNITYEDKGKYGIDYDDVILN